MARKSRVVLNREALHAFDLAMASGMEAWADAVLERADVPDAPPYGVGLTERGGWIAYVDGRKVGEASRRTAVKKPRAMRVRGRGIAIGVGYGFPARFQETGTIDQPARPFLFPAVASVVGDGGLVYGALRAALAAELGRRQRRLSRPKGRSSAIHPTGSGPFDFGTFMSRQRGFAG